MSEEFWKKNVECSVDISAKDLLDFAQLTGDDAAHHLDKSIAQSMGYKDVVSQGLLVLALSGRASSQYLRVINRNGVTYGYDKIRFPGSVFAGDCINMKYEPQSISEKMVITSLVTLTNLENKTVVAATHILKLMD